MTKIKTYKNYNFWNSEIKNLRKSQEVLKLNKKITSNYFEYVAVPCLCHSTEFDRVSSIDRYGILQDTLICKSCGLIQSNPRMSEKDLRKFYEDDFYRNIYTEKLSIEEYTKYKFQRSEGKNIFDFIDKNLKLNQSTEIIEIGSGGGWNLAFFKKRGFNVTGLEYSIKLAKLGGDYGINVIQGGIEKLKGKYDIIIINHVLEHFLNPVRELIKIKEHLKPNGAIYISVPDISNFGLSQIQNVHMYYFNRFNFKFYVEKAGLKMIKFEASETIHMCGLFINAEDKEKIKFDTDILKRSKAASYRNLNKYKLKSYFKNIMNFLGKCNSTNIVN